MDAEVALWMLAVAAAPGVLAVVVAAVLLVKLRRIRAEQKLLLPDGTQVGLVERQAALARTAQELDGRIDAVRDEVRRLTEHTNTGLRSALRFQGVVRYDAYADIGGEQSWSMAILNAERTGAVISSLHARDHARVYLKEITAGASAQRLSPEEQLAIARAMGDPAPEIAPMPVAS